MKIYGYAELIWCEWRNNGVVIAWRASNSAYWRMALDAVRALPVPQRVYLAEERLWWIDRAAFATLGSDVFSNFNDARFFAEETATMPVMPSEVVQAFAALHLTPDAPVTAVQAVYRALARQHHPDAGGDELTMKRLNAVYELARGWAEQHAA